MKGTIVSLDWVLDEFSKAGGGDFEAWKVRAGVFHDPKNKTWIKGDAA
jgi:hypothetical protein